MNRRRLLKLGIAAAAFMAGGGHTPYQQWTVYRLKHLLIGTSKADPASYAIGKRVAALLAERLPESKARVTRGPDARRLASLIATGQIAVIVLRRAEAAALAEGSGDFAAYGPVALYGLFDLGDHILVSRGDFPDRHAYLVAKTLTEHTKKWTGTGQYSDGPVPVHAGARAFALKQPLPNFEESDVVAAPGSHRH